MGTSKEVDIRELVRAHIRKTYKTQREAAKAWGMTTVHLSRILNEHSPMPDSIAALVGYQIYQPEAMWVRIKK